MHDESLDALLTQHPFFRDLDPQAIAFLADNAEERTLESGTVLFEHGQPAHRFYLLRSGRITVGVPAIEGPSLEVRTLAAGEILGWSWLIPPYRSQSEPCNRIDALTEYFETFDEQGRPAGLAARPTVHRDGLWHRAVHVWLFRSDGRVYVQRRAPDKDVSPDCLDVSVGEHLQPGEDFLEAAYRGLSEELGVVDVQPVALGGERRITQRRPEVGIHDREIQRVFHVVYDGEVEPEPTEIAALELWAMDRLRAEVTRSPDAFTPGLRADLDLP